MRRRWLLLASVMLLGAAPQPTATLTWSAPANPVGVPSLLAYDVVRTVDVPDFVNQTCPVPCATCVPPFNTNQTTLTDPAIPMNGQVFYYLVRAENPCGEGSLGVNSTGTPTPGRSCP